MGEPTLSAFLLIFFASLGTVPTDTFVYIVLLPLFAFAQFFSAWTVA